MLLRLCERKGWTLGQWYALDAREQLEWLAYEHHREKWVETMMNNMRKSKHGITDAAAYVALYLENL